VSRVHCIIVRSIGTPNSLFARYQSPKTISIGTVGVFDGWSSYGTMTLERGRKDQRCEQSAVDNRRPLIFDEGESFTLRVRTPAKTESNSKQKVTPCRLVKMQLLNFQAIPSHRTKY